MTTRETFQFASRWVLYAGGGYVIYEWMRGLNVANETFKRIWALPQVPMPEATLAIYYFLIAFAQPVAVTVIWCVLVVVYGLEFGEERRIIEVASPKLDEPSE